MPATVAILDPMGEVVTSKRPLAPRLEDFRGKRLGIIDNGMPGSDVLLSSLGQFLVERAGVAEVIMRKKPNISKPAPAEIIAELTEKCDFVICGAGVWGSCTSCSVHDGVTVEKAGIPAVTMVGDEFTKLALAKRESMGLPEFQPVYVPYPLGTPEEIRRKAETAYDTVVGVLSGRIVQKVPA